MSSFGTRDESMSHGIPMGPVCPMGIPQECESLSYFHGNGNGLMGIEGNGNSIFSHFQSEEENQPVSGAKSAYPGTLAESNALDCHRPPATKRCVFDFKDLCGPEDDQQQSRNELAEYVNLNCNGSGRKWEEPMGMGRKWE